jgi:hypothetical protein
MLMIMLFAWCYVTLKGGKHIKEKVHHVWYIAKNEKGTVYLFPDKPSRGVDCWRPVSYYKSLNMTGVEIPKEVNPQWQDRRPIKVDVTISKHDDYE